MSASNAAAPLPTIKILDPRIDVLRRREYVICKGGDRRLCVFLKEDAITTYCGKFLKL